MSYESTRLTYKSCAAALTLGLLLCANARAQEVKPPTSEKPFGGTIEIGNRWRWFAGNEEMYRSTLNLGEGPKVFNFSTAYQAGEKHASIRATSWGGEPGSALHFSFGRDGRFDVFGNYRRLDYFNAVPSFANPTAARAGATQSALDITRRLADFRIAFHPEHHIEPFVGVEFDSGRGPGRTTFVENANEYVVRTDLDNSATTVRAGIEARYDRWNGAIEIGGSRFHDNQGASASGPNSGNRATLYLGQRLELDGLKQEYKVRGTDRFARAVLESRPHSKISLNGRFSFSEPKTRADYDHAAAGRFVVAQTLQTLTNESLVAHSEASWPHPSGSVGVEFRPTERWRLTESVSTERFHIATLAANLTTQRVDAIFDVSRFISLYAGHSYQKAAATSAGSRLAEPETRNVQRNEENAGVTFRYNSRFKVSLDLRSLDGDGIFFRTEKLHRKRAQVRGRYQINDALAIGASTSLWNNDNGFEGVDFTERSREASADISFAPKGGKRVSVFATYTRGTFRSDLPFLVPQNFQRDHSVYRDHGHNGSVAVLLHGPRLVYVQLGGNLSVATARFFNPYARISVGMMKNATWKAEWSWHAYTHMTFRPENYRAHLLTTGIEYRF